MSTSPGARSRLIIQQQATGTATSRRWHYPRVDYPSLRGRTKAPGVIACLVVVQRTTVTRSLPRIPFSGYRGGSQSSRSPYFPYRTCRRTKAMGTVRPRGRPWLLRPLLERALRPQPLALGLNKRRLLPLARPREMSQRRLQVARQQEHSFIQKPMHHLLLLYSVPILGTVVPRPRRDRVLVLGVDPRP